MSKEKETFAKIIREAPEPTQEPMTFVKVLEGMKEAAGAVWDGAIRHAEHGSAELMSAAYTGNAYVPYGWSKTDHDVEPPKTPEVTHENDGHER